MIDSGKLNSAADKGYTFTRVRLNLYNLPSDISDWDILEEIYIMMPKYKGIKISVPRPSYFVFEQN